MAILSVKNMNIAIDVGGIKKTLVDHVSFDVEKGEILGLVGASGSGKSITSMSIARLLHEEYEVSSDGVLLNGINLHKLTEKELCKIRGKDISYVFQEPMTSLNPVFTIRDQVEEPLVLHEDGASTEVERLMAVKSALSDAGLAPTDQLLKSYPHQLSGGQRQRAMIAMAMINKPQVLVADEITTALDVDTRDKIIDVLLEYKKIYNTSIIFISHDLKLVKRIADRILVMKNGKIIETLDNKGFDAIHYEKVINGTGGGNDSDINYKKTVLEVKNLAFSYAETSVFGKKTVKKVLENVSFNLHEGETLGLVGKSGSGKSTIVKTVVGLQKSNYGEINFLKGYENPQMVFQDPYTSLNPAHTVGWILNEALLLGDRRAGIRRKKSERKKAVIEMLNSVDLITEMGYRKIDELSGGQRQRVAIACALISKPRIVVLDEPVSAVDAAVTDQILDLLKRLKKEYGLSYIFISHDPEVIAKICDRVLVVEDGKVKEKR